jgi:hypothetical protein
MACAAIAACKTDPTPVRPKASAATTAAKPSPTPASVASRVLVAGQGGRTLTGTVVVDAGYVVAQGGGNLLTIGGKQIVGVGNLMTAGNSGTLITNDGGSLITNDGGSIITNDGGSIISNDGGSLINNGGSTIVAQGAGNLITNDGGSLITNDGGSLVADDGTTLLANGIVAQGAGNIVAQGAGNIVAQGAGNIVAQGAGNFGLLATTPRPSVDPPAPGTQLPAAGMVISVVSLDTHKYVPLGRNAAGKPVYSIYSDARGGYKIYPEADPEENLLVVTSAPGSRDPRRALNVLGTAHGPTEVPVEANTDLASKFLRVAFAAQLKVLVLRKSPPGVPPCNKSEAQDMFVALLGQDYVDRIQQIAYDNRIWALDRPTLDKLALELADILLARADLNAIQTLPNKTRPVIPDEAKGLQPEPVMGALLHVLDLATKAWPVDPHAFDCDGANQAQLERVCSLITKYELPRPRVESPYDLADFAINHMLWTADHAAVDGMGDLMTVAKVEKPVEQQYRLIGVITGVEFALATSAANDGFKERFAQKVETIKVADPASVPTPAPIPSGGCVPDPI